MIDPDDVEQRDLAVTTTYIVRCSVTSPYDGSTLTGDGATRGEAMRRLRIAILHNALATNGKTIVVNGERLDAVDPDRI